MAPTITIAIPLHGSARWVDNVAANVRRLPQSVTEILISDRTCLDDAAEQLRERLADDPRVTVHVEKTGLGFVGHFHLLMEIAEGELFMWMPHDDIFDAAWVPTLASALADHPKAWLAFGQLRWVEADGLTPTGSRPFPRGYGVISRRTAIRLMGRGRLAIAFRGLFRRREVMEAGVRMDADTSLVAVDHGWVFTVALLSALVYDDRAITWKRIYEGSTSTTTSWKSQNRGNGPQAAVAILRRRGPGGLAGAALRLYAAWIGIGTHARTRISSVMPTRMRRILRRFL